MYHGVGEAVEKKRGGWGEGGGGGAGAVRNLVEC